MALTPAQKAALKANILASGDLEPLTDTPDGRFAIATLYNLAAAPTWVVWRTRVTRSEILQNGFDWTRLDNLSVGKARVWSDIFVEGSINPSKANVRVGIDAVWVGTQADLDQRAAVYVHCKRNATRAEKLFSTGTGTTPTPATVAVELPEGYQVTFSDVDSALNLP